MENQNRASAETNTDFAFTEFERLVATDAHRSTHGSYTTASQESEITRVHCPISLQLAEILTPLVSYRFLLGVTSAPMSSRLSVSDTVPGLKLFGGAGQTA